MRRLHDDDIARIIAAAAPKPAAEPVPWLEQAEHRTITVHTTDGHSLQGILRVAAEDGILLWAPRMLQGEKPVDLDGEVFVAREKVAFIQTSRS